MKKYQELEEVFKAIWNLKTVNEFLNWDSATIMPKKSADSRSENIESLTSLAHTIISDPALGDLLENLDDKNLNDWQSANADRMLHEWNHANALDKKLVKELTIAGQKCENIWRTAKKENNFKKLAPSLQEVFNLVREKAKSKADFFGCSPYQALLDEFDPGRKDEDVEKIFTELENFLPDFIQNVQEKQKDWQIPQLGDNFAINHQKSLTNVIMKDMGFDFDRGMINESIHPFSCGPRDDARITTNYDKKDFLKSLMGVIHETGHALYQQGLPKDYYNQPVGQDCGLTIHESQSLFWEMQISRSMDYMHYLLPKVKKHFKISDDIKVEDLYKLQNHVKPSFIRIDADEVTYPLHVILRYKIEKYIISGDVDVKNLEEAWNQGVEKYLNIVPQKYSEGCIQDIHWMDGTFGYFPVYALGAIASSQLISKAKTDIDDFSNNVQAGKFAPILKWLRDNVHSKGWLYDSDELLEQVTGKKLDVTFFKNYLKEKYLGENV